MLLLKKYLHSNILCASRRSSPRCSRSPDMLACGFIGARAELDTNQGMLLVRAHMRMEGEGQWSLMGRDPSGFSLVQNLGAGWGSPPRSDLLATSGRSPRHGTVPALERGNYRKRRDNAYALPSQYGMLEDAGKKVHFSQIKQATFVNCTP
jgi:hypothetical protein